MNESRHTITLSTPAYEKLRGNGKFGESYSQLVLRLIRELELHDKAGKDKA